MNPKALQRRIVTHQKPNIVPKVGPLIGPSLQIDANQMARYESQEQGHSRIDRHRETSFLQLEHVSDGSDAERRT